MASQNHRSVQNEVPEDPAVLVVRGALALAAHFAENLRDDAQRGEQSRINHAAHLDVHGVGHAKHRRDQIRAPRELRVQNDARTGVERVSSEAGRATRRRFDGGSGAGEESGEERSDDRVDGLFELVSARVVAEEVEQEDEKLLLDDERTLRGLFEESGEQRRENYAVNELRAMSTLEIGEIADGAVAGDVDEHVGDGDEQQVGRHGHRAGQRAVQQTEDPLDVRVHQPVVQQEDQLLEAEQAPDVELRDVVPEHIRVAHIALATLDLALHSH